MNELTKHRQTALHLAAQQDLATICSVLLENGVDFPAVDENGNNGACPYQQNHIYNSNTVKGSNDAFRGPIINVPTSLVFVSALHLAVMQGRLNNVRALLTESNIDAEAYNLRSAYCKSHVSLN